MTAPGEVGPGAASASRADPRVVAILRQFSSIAALVVFGVGIAVLIGWVVGAETLKGVFPGLATMKVNAALCFILAGFALFAHRWNGASGGEAPASTDSNPKGRASVWDRVVDALGKGTQAERVSRICAVIVVVVGFLTLLEWSAAWDLGIDDVLIRDLGTPAGSFPGRMAPSTATILALIGLALLLEDRPRVAQSLLVVAALGALLAIAGYLYGVASLYQFGPFSSMALNTAVSFLVLSGGILASDPDRGFVATFSSSDAGGVILRRFLPAIVLIPLIGAWFRLKGQEAGLYPFEFGLAVFVLLNVVVFAILTLWTAGALNRFDAERKRALESTRQTAERLAILHDVDRAILGTVRSLDIVRTAMSRIRAILSAEGVRVVLFGEGDRRGEVFEEGEASGWYVSVARDPRSNAGSPGSGGPPTVRRTVEPAGNQLSAPLVYDDAEIGALQVLTAKEAPLTEEQIEVVREVADQMSVALRQARLQERIVDAERSAVIGRMSAYLAHELNTPLANLALLAAAAQRSTADKKLLERLGKMDDQRRRMTKIISHLLTLGKTLQLKEQATDVRAVVQAALDEMEPFSNPAVKLSASLGDDPVILSVDSSLLQEVFVNLVKNALQATAAGSVSVDLKVVGPTAVVYVSDTGTGMPQDVVRQLFQPFFTTKKSEEGTGLGLAFCKAVVVAHKGDLKVASDVGKGTTFAVVLPIPGASVDRAARPGETS